MQLRKETCIGCECELQYTKSIPTKQMGVMMHMGERFAPVESGRVIQTQ